MIALALALAGVPPVFVDARADSPWVVVVAPGEGPHAETGPCGTRVVMEGPAAQRDELVAQAERAPPARRPAPRPRPPVALPLRRTPGLLGLEGELVVVLAERALLRAGTNGGRVRIVIDPESAALAFDGVDAAAVVAALSAPWPDNEMESAVRIARARVAARRATVGAWARERADRVACFGYDDSGDDLDVRALRARLRP